MRLISVRGTLALVVAVAATGWTLARPAAAPQQAAVAPQSLSVLAFSPTGVLFAADPQAATIYALELGAQSAGGKTGAADVAAIDQKIAALLRVDGDGKITIVSLDGVKSSKVSLTNPPSADAPRNQRADAVTDMAFVNGRLVVAGLSNEEFASKLRSIPYPFAAADPGTSVEIFHGNHGQLETRSPVNTFIPYTINNKQYLIASYTCTPLVRFSLDSLNGSKVVGTMLAELGNRNRPLDMFVYQKDGREFVLMSNNSRGVMKIPTDSFGTAAPITEPVKTETGGIAYEKVASMTGIEQMDQLDRQRSIVLTRTPAGLNLAAVPLP